MNLGASSPPSCVGKRGRNAGPPPEVTGRNVRTKSGGDNLATGWGIIEEPWIVSLSLS